MGEIASYYMFNAGINYRDNQLAMNELEDGKNVCWAEGLKRRNGYEKRNATLDASAAYAGGDVLSIIDYTRYKYGSDEKMFLFVSVDSGGGLTADKMVVFESSAVPSTASAAFTPLGSAAYALDWTTGTNLSISQLKNKVYMANGEDNPYVLFDNGGWKTGELLLCENDNSASANGADIIANGSMDDWSGSDWLAGFDHFLYVSDGNTMYFGISDKEGDASEGIETGGSTLITGIEESWNVDWYITLDSEADISRATPFQTYLFLIGKEALYHFYNVDFDNYNYGVQRVSDKGVRSNLLVTSGAMFWVGDDGIYGYDGTYIVNLSMKIWDHIEAQHSSIPSDFDDCSLAYFKGYVWVSFPNGTNKEVFVFDPSQIYQDERGNTHAPFYRYLYYTGAAPVAKGFKKLKRIDDQLFAIDGAVLYELEVEAFDNNSDATNKVPISWYSQSAYIDQENPGLKKTYRKATIETAANMDTTVALTVTFYRDHGEGSSTTSTLDTTYTGNQRSYNELSVPYNIDGNSISLKVDGAAASCSGTAACMFYGFTLDYEVLGVSKTEVS